MLIGFWRSENRDGAPLKETLIVGSSLSTFPVDSLPTALEGAGPFKERLPGGAAEKSRKREKGRSRRGRGGAGRSRPT